MPIEVKALAETRQVLQEFTSLQLREKGQMAACLIKHLVSLQCTIWNLGMGSEVKMM